MGHQRVLLTLLPGLLMLFLALALTPEKGFSSPQPDRVKNNASEPLKIGIFVDYISRVNLAQKNVELIFWVWFKGTKGLEKSPGKEAFNPSSFDITNAEKMSIMQKEEIKGEDEFWHGYKIRATLFQNWKLKNFPFTVEPLKIVIEDYYLNETHTHYVPDRKHSMINYAMPLQGWHIGEGTWHITNSSFNNNFGIIHPGSNATSRIYYSRATYQIGLQNNNLRTYIKLFALLYLATFIIFCVSFLPIEELRSRVALNSAAIFAVVGNILTTNEVMPATETMTIVDKAQAGFLIYMSILLMAMLVNVYIYRWRCWVGRLLNTIMGITTITLGVSVHLYLSAL